MSRRLIKGGYLVSVDPNIGDMDGGDLLIENGKISAIGKNLSPAGADILDATGMIVLPGLIDTHRHIWQGPMRSVTADWSLLNYLGGIRMTAAGSYRAEDMYAAQLQGALEAINAGVTTVADYCHNINSPDHALEAMRGLEEAGIRAVWGYGFNRPPLRQQHFDSLEERLNFARKLAAEHFSSSESLLSFAVAPEEASLWPSEEAGIAQFELAREFGGRIMWHCNVINIGGQRPREVAYLKQTGLLASDIVLVHMHYTTPDEWSLVAECGASLSFTPDTELQMGMGHPSTTLARQYGITQSYGADIISNNSADMFTPLRMALQVARAELNAPKDGDLYDGVAIKCTEALRWGTIDAARALGLDHRIGSLTPGKDADIIMLNGRSISLVGWDRTNPAATIIQQASAMDVDTVMIRGRILKQNGRMLADVARACDLLERSAQHIAHKVNAAGGFYVDPSRTVELLQSTTSLQHADAFQVDNQGERNRPD